MKLTKKQAEILKMLCDGERLSNVVGDDVERNCETVCRIPTIRTLIKLGLAQESTPKWYFVVTEKGMEWEKENDLSK